MVVTEKLPNETNREYAFRVIKQNIIDINIRPGSMVGEQELAQELNLSRTPVHEAFLELSKTRMVEILPQRGCRVSLIDPAMIEEARFMRQTLETAIAALACERATEEDLVLLESNLKLQEFYLAEGNPTELNKLDNEFHFTLYKICNMTQCYYMVNSMSIHFDRVRLLSLYTVRDLKIVGDHRRLLEALRQRDPEQCRVVIAKHLSRVQYDEMEIRERYPEYFVQ